MFNKSLYRKTFVESEEAAFILGVSKKTLYNWKLAGKLKAVNMGETAKGRLRIPISELERILGGAKIVKMEEPNGN